MGNHGRDGLYLRGRTWWVSYRVGRRRVRESTGFSDRRSAELVLAKIKVSLKEGKWFEQREKAVTPLKEAISQFIEVYAKPRKVSWAEDELMLRRFHAHRGDTAILQDVARLDIEQFLRQLLTSGLSHGRVNRYIASLKSFWNRQIEWGKATHNPVKGIKLYPESMRTQYLELGQIRELLHACSSRLRPIVQVALLTGLRKSDILNLKWESISLDRRELSVVQGKTQTRLTISISDALARVLAGIPRTAGCPFVFHSGNEPVRQFGWLRTDFQAACVAAGLPEGKRLFHVLRHTVATQLRFLGKDLTLIKEQLGHKSIRMTLRYAHIAPDELRRAADQLGARIGGSEVQCQLEPSDRLVTIWSQSRQKEVEAKAADDGNMSNNQPVLVLGAAPTGRAQQTVNTSPDRREESEQDALRRADDDWS